MKYLIILLLSFQLLAHEDTCPCNTGNSKYDIGELKKLKLWVSPGFSLNSTKTGSKTTLNINLGANYFFNGILGVTFTPGFMPRGFNDTPYTFDATYIDLPVGITFVNRGNLATNQFTLLSLGFFYGLPLSGSSDMPGVPKDFDPEALKGFFFDGIMSFPIKGRLTYGLYSSIKFSFNDMLKNATLGSNNPTNYSFGLAIVY